MNFKLHELVAATHSPFGSDGSLKLSAVENQASHLLKDGMKAVFICGTTGESTSLTLEERLSLAKQWMDVTRGTPMRVIVHVGSNCLTDSRMLAAQAQSLGAAAIAALAPTYFKPRNVEDLISCCQEVAGAAPAVPFYYYDIPSLSGVTLSTPDFLDAAADRIPTLVGVKFTNADLMAYQRSLRSQGGRFDIPWGIDEHLLGGLAMGARGAVGSTYNFAGPIYHRLVTAFNRGDLPAARVDQYRAVQLIGVLASYGYMAAAKTLMEFLGIEVGPPRLPNAALRNEQVGQLRKDLKSLGFFEWIRQ